MAIEEELLARLGEKEKWIAVLEESLAESEIELHRLQDKVRELESLRNSATYKVVHRVARSTSRIAPPGSRRRRMLHLGFRVLRAVPKLRDRQWVAHTAKVAFGPRMRQAWPVARFLPDQGATVGGSAEDARTHALQSTPLPCL